MDRNYFAKLIIERFESENIDSLKKKYACSGPINHLVIDNLFPTNFIIQIKDCFPAETDLYHLKGPQENKFVGIKFDQSQKIIEECLFSFQDKRVISLVSQITDIDDLKGDEELYAGGVSSMSYGCFLNPHIDNSHDRLRKNYRRLNLLYYVNEGFNISDGGELALFPNGIRKEPKLINCRFNRLVIMRTDNRSLHAVNHIKSRKKIRRCISNYYFSEKSPLKKDYYHSTSFRGFPNETLKDVYLKSSGSIRTSIKFLTGNFFGKVINGNHFKGVRK